MKGQHNLQCPPKGSKLWEPLNQSLVTPYASADVKTKAVNTVVRNGDGDLTDNKE